MTAEEELVMLKEENEKLRKTVARRDLTIADYERQLEWLRKQIFGRKSEKKHLPLDPDALTPSIFGDTLTAEERKQLQAEQKKAEEAVAKAVKPAAPKDKPRRREIDLSKLPVNDIHLYPEGTTDTEGHLTEGFVEIGTEVTLKIERVPARLFVNRIIRHKVKAKAQSGDDRDECKILISPLPPSPIAKSNAGASLLADIIISKFADHLPFYRIIRRYTESGLTVPQAKMGGWYEASVESLKYLYDPLRKQIMSSRYIQVDESTVPVIDNEKHATRKGYEWLVRDGITGQTFFWYDRGSRSGKTARELLGGYTGVVQTDGYEAYDQFEKTDGITLASCWAHVRRKFTDSLEENRRLATEAINMIKLLYKVEEEARVAGLTPDQTAWKRKKESYPVILAFEKWLENNYDTVLPQSNIGRAIAYSYALIDRLSVYVTDGNIAIDNNAIERQVKPLAIGRKNWLFCGNDASAYRAAIVYSLLASCTAVGVDQRAWLEDVLNKIPAYRSSGRDPTGLLPLNWHKQ